MSNVHSSFPCSYSYTLQAGPPFYIASKATAREHESEWRNFSPPTLKWFVATSPSGELARRLSPASVWKRTGKGKLRRSRTRWAREEGRNGIYPFPLLLPSYFMFPCAIWYPTWQCCITLELSTFCSNSLFFMRSFLARSQNCKQPENPAVLWCPFQSHLSVKWNINFEQYTR